MFDGQPLTREIIDSYRQRGLIEKMPDVEKVVTKKAAKINREAKRVERWRLLQYWMGRMDKLEHIAHAVGFTKGIYLTRGVEQNGERMAKTYGKLPRPRLGYKYNPIWEKVTE